MTEKLKSFLADDALYYCLLLILVAVGSFGLGRLSINNFTENNIASVGNGVSITQNAISNEKNVEIKGQIEVVASKSGTKYHRPDCPGAKQIKEANLIRFTSIELAEAAGYTPAANCPSIQ